MICELEKSLEAILCFHQGFLIKYSSTLSRLSIVTVSSPARNYNIWFSPSLFHLSLVVDKNEKNFHFYKNQQLYLLYWISQFTFFLFCWTNCYIWWIFDEIFFHEIFYVCCVVKTKFWKERKWFLMVSPHGAASGGEVVTAQSVDWRAGGFSWLSPGSCCCSEQSRGWRKLLASRPTALSTRRSCSYSSQIEKIHWLNVLSIGQFPLNQKSGVITFEVMMFLPVNRVSKVPQADPAKDDVFRVWSHLTVGFPGLIRRVISRQRNLDKLYL